MTREWFGYAVVLIISAFWAMSGWMFAAVLFPSMEFMVPVTITLIHLTYAAYVGITTKHGQLHME